MAVAYGAVMTLVAALRRELGPSGVLTGSDAEPYLTSWRGLFGSPAVAVARPATTTETATVVRACAEVGVAIVPQGGNTGLSGGAVPAKSADSATTRPTPENAGLVGGAVPATSAGGGSPSDDGPPVVLSLSRMNRILSVNPDRWTITAEAGATIEAVQQAAAQTKRLFAPDWGARGTATVGGAISTDAGGNNVLRYGTMRQQVLGLEVVLADGRIWDGMRALRKDSSGYDLKQLFIGAEGTLGVVTRAVLQLHPAMPHSQSALAAICGLDRLMPLLELATACCGDDVTAFELVPEVGLQRVCDKFGLVRPLPARQEFYVLMKLTSAEPVSERLGTFLQRASERGLVSDAAVAVTDEQENRLWTIRDELPATGLWPQHAHGLKLDTAVPVDRFGDYHDQVRRIAADMAPGTLAYGFGHVGDGNLHMMVLPTSDDQIAAFLAVRDQLRERIDEATVACGGTLSAEHGIGQLLRHRVQPQKPAIEWELMRTIKGALDPQGIMNPHKTLPMAG